LIEKGFDRERVAVLAGGVRGLHRAGYPMEGSHSDAVDPPTAVTEASITGAWQAVDVLPALRKGLAPHYTVEREIGAGGMARVFLAQERHPSRKVAVKVLHPELSTPLFRARFIREIDLVSKLSHPNIVPILAADECLYVPQGPEGLCYYVMPYVEGPSLRERLQKDMIVPLAEAIHIGQQVAEGLSYAHAQGIIHRDVKPENILQANGRVMVADFGIARAISAAGGKTLTAVGLPIGTPGYMSPEQLVGMAIDSRTDVYSLACVFYEMVVGRPPLLDVVDREVTSALRAQGVGRRVIVRLNRVLTRALAPAPADRFAGVDEFASALRDAGQSRPLDRFVPTIDRRVVVAGIAVLVLALAAASFIPIVRGPKLEPRRAVVAAFENLSGDSALAPLGQLTAHWVTDGLARDGALEVVPVGTTGRLDAAGLRELAAASGAVTIVLGSYYRDGDSVRFLVHIVDGERGVVRRTLAPVAAPVRAPHQAAERLRIGVAAAIETLIGRQR
jgi:serine/threonine-protein kinase